MKNGTLRPLRVKDLHSAHLKFRGHFSSLGEVTKVAAALNRKAFGMIIPSAEKHCHLNSSL